MSHKQFGSITPIGLENAACPTGNSRKFDPEISDLSTGLLAEIQSALRDTGRITLRDVVVELLRDEVVLHGRVNCYYDKQLAQAVSQRITRQTLDKRRVVNAIEVASS